MFVVQSDFFNFALPLVQFAIIGKYLMNMGFALFLENKRLPSFSCFSYLDFHSLAVRLIVHTFFLFFICFLIAFCAYICCKLTDVVQSFHAGINRVRIHVHIFIPLSNPYNFVCDFLPFPVF